MPSAFAPAASFAPARATVDLAALMKIRSLELRAKVVVEGLWRGLHRSPTHGFSVEFTEYRPYSPGDDVRALDWRLYARSDRDYVKKYEDETNLRCQLLVDQSRSMAWKSADLAHSKADYAATFAATLASFLFAQGDAVGVTTFAGSLGAHLPARNRPGQLRRVLHALEQPAEGRASEVGQALQKVAALLRRRGMLVLVSDLLMPAEECQRPLAALRAAGHEVLVVQVLDRGELSLRLDQATRLRDLETDQVLDVDPRQAAAGYQAAVAQHLQALERICLRLGIERRLLLTDQPLEAALVALIGGRGQRRGRR
jgi:uncharacterized protein (DUF58 family)